jgi:hypothetical protein
MPTCRTEPGDVVIDPIYLFIRFIRIKPLGTPIITTLRPRPRCLLPPLAALERVQTIGGIVVQRSESCDAAGLLLSVSSSPASSFR